MTINLKLPDGAIIDSAGVWAQKLQPCSPDRPGLFLDRDGVVLKEVKYLHTIDDTRLIPGTVATIAKANKANIPVIIVTNQSGIGRGYYSWHEFIAVQNKFLSQLRAVGAFVDAVFACPHHAKAKPPFNHPNHPARKPNPGMLLQAKEMLSLNIAASWIIGDKSLDIEAGKNAGLAGGMHVLTGHGSNHGERQAALALADKTFNVMSGASIIDGASILSKIFKS